MKTNCTGTDTSPQSMLESIRWSAVLGKIADRRADSWTARDVLNSATVNAADALGREDLGRVAVGAKADLLFWRTDSATMSPVRDPIRNLVYYATREDLRSVLVDGRWLMHDGELVTLDDSQLAARLQEAGDRAWSRVPDRDRLGRAMSEVSPDSLPQFEI